MQNIIQQLRNLRNIMAQNENLRQEIIDFLESIKGKSHIGGGESRRAVQLYNRQFNDRQPENTTCDVCIRQHIEKLRRVIYGKR